MSLDQFGNQGAASGWSNAYNVAASTVIKAGPGRLVRVSVITAGAAAIGNQIGVVPAAIGIYYFDWPCLTGIVYVPGAAQVVAISYD